MASPAEPGGKADRVTILLPMTGPRADIGQAMLQAARLALPGDDLPRLEALDTGGTPEGAASAARAALAGGAGLILGPLTSAETAAVAPIARDGGVAVLAFTNDPSQAQPGVWTLGITPGQQVRRLVAAAHAESHDQLAALVPQSDFGRLMGEALTQAASAASLPPPAIRTYEPNMGSITAAIRSMAEYDRRRGPVDAQIKAARARGTAEGRHAAQELAKQTIPPPSFNALLLADSGEALAEIAAVLPYYDIDRGTVRIMGPAQWAAPASGAGAFGGAWYAAPDPASRTAMVAQYNEKYGAPPPGIADLAFDAASIARAVGAKGRFSIAALTQPGGFGGVDGWLALLPDGQVRRGLAVFNVDRGGASMVDPAPNAAGGPGT